MLIAKMDVPHLMIIPNVLIVQVLPKKLDQVFKLVNLVILHVKDVMDL